MSNAEDPDRPLLPISQRHLSTAAYPYHNGGYPPPHYSDHWYTQRNYHHDRDYKCLHALQLIFIFVATTYIIVGIVHLPQDPQFRVESFSISNFTLGNDLLDNFTSEVRLSVRNPSEKTKLVYCPIEAKILYGSESLSGTTVPRFAQGTENETSVAVDFAEVENFLGRRVVVGINRDRMRNGIVSFNLVMQSKVSSEGGPWKYMRYLKVLCGELTVSIQRNGMSGTLTGGPRQCQVEFTVLP